MKEGAIAETRNDTVAQVQAQADHPVPAIETDRQRKKMTHEEVVQNPATTVTIRPILVEIVRLQEIGDIVTEEADPIRGQKDAQLQTDSGNRDEIVAEAEVAIITDPQ